jgi:hypothetical protein
LDLDDLYNLEALIINKNSDYLGSSSVFASDSRRSKDARHHAGSLGSANRLQGKIVKMSDGIRIVD